MLPVRRVWAADRITRRDGGQRAGLRGVFGSGAEVQFTPSIVLSSALAEAGGAPSSPSQVVQARLEPPETTNLTRWMPIPVPAQNLATRLPTGW